MITKEVYVRLAFGELEDETLIPLLKIYVIFENERYDSYTVMKGSDVSEEKFIEDGKHIADDTFEELVGKEYDEKELFSILEKYDIFTELPNYTKDV